MSEAEVGAGKEITATGEAAADATECDAAVADAAVADAAADAAGSDELPGGSACFLGCLALVLLAVVVGPVVGVVYGIVLPNRRAQLDREGRKECFANQRALTAAFIKFDIDQSKKVEQLDFDLAHEFVTEGYLSGFPECPAIVGYQRPPGPYRIASPGVGRHPVVFCLTHGFIEPPGGSEAASPRDQLLAAGCEDVDLWTEASADRPPGSQ